MVDERMDKKVEASIPVQSRVDIRVLANMLGYWEKEGRYIKSMSQLVNWSMDLCVQVLSINGRLPTEIDTILEANNMLVSRGLYQKSMKRRADNKIIRARQLENLRFENVSPNMGSEGRREYDLAHNSHTIVPAPDMGIVKSYISDELYEKAKKDRLDELIEEAKKNNDRIEYDEEGYVKTDIKFTGYSEEQRKKDIQEARDSLNEKLGVTNTQKVEVDTSEVEELLEKIKEKNYNKSAEPSSYNSQSQSQGQEQEQDHKSSIPRKLSNEEIEAKEQEILDRDHKEQSAWDDFDPSDLKPSAE